VFKGKKRRLCKMKCDVCGYEGFKATFRYLYNTTLDSQTAYRECPKCYKWVLTDEMKEEQIEKVAK
jgi:hypothetical protein